MSTSSSRHLAPEPTSVGPWRGVSCSVCMLGVLGAAYNRTILLALDRLAAFPGVPAPWRAAAVGGGVGLVAWFEPRLVGGGDPLLQAVLTPPLSLVTRHRISRSLATRSALLCRRHAWRSIYAAAAHDRRRRGRDRGADGQRCGPSPGHVASTRRDRWHGCLLAPVVRARKA